MPEIPKLVIHYGANYENVRDITRYVKELKITHEDIDAKGAGRDSNTGVMVRSIQQRVHTFEIVLRRVTQSEIRAIHTAVMNVHNPFFRVDYLAPCATNRTRTAYVSTMNYGAQRYNKKTNVTFYDGVSFKIIERGGDGNDDDD